MMRFPNSPPSQVGHRPLREYKRGDFFELKEVKNDTRTFTTGATRDTDTDKLDFEGFLSPLVLERYAKYLHKHRIQSDGKYRSSDNWQKGIPLKVYMQSGWRHFFDWWKEHRGLLGRDGIEDAICGLLFNAMGYLHELLKKKTLFKTIEDPYSPGKTRTLQE